MNNMTDHVNTSTLTTDTATTTTAATTATSPRRAFKPTSLIPHLATTTAKQVVLREHSKL